MASEVTGPGAAGAEGSADEDLTVQEALELALDVQRRGYLQSADEIYQRILSAAPDHTDALHFMALGRYRMGRGAEAVEMLSLVLARDPANIHARNNLGNILSEGGQVEAARQMYEGVLAQNPPFPAARANLGALLRKQGDLGGAEAAFREALTLDPDHASALHNLGSLLWDLDRISEALTFYQRALVLVPYDGESYRRVGASLAVLGRVDESLAVFRRWLELEPQSELARHMLAACSGVDVPGRASDGFVEKTFDMFAESFDAVLARLDYRAPALVAGAVEVALGAPAATLDVLDAGAGTGLCGPALRPYARRLVGIDLSMKMLEKARVRAVYDELVPVELTAFMRANPRAYDLITSADTLCYFGDLAEALAGAAGALRPGGHLVFTVERTPAGEESAYRLNPHGRYSHGDAYVRRALATAGLVLVTMDRANLRIENKSAVDGLVVTARLGAAAPGDVA